MSAPENPYAERVPPANMSPYERIGMDALASAGSAQKRIPEPSGLHAIDLQHIAERNWRAGYRARDEEAQVAEREHPAALAQAWEEGAGQMGAHIEARAEMHMESILRLLAAKLEPAKGVSDAQARRASAEIVHGALTMLLADDLELVQEDGSATAERLTATGFARLDALLQSAARSADDDDQEE